MNATLGVFTRPWNMLDYEAALPHMAASFSVGGIMRNGKTLAINLDSAVEQARGAVAAARKCGIEIVCFLAPVSSVSESAQAAARDFKRYVDLAAAAGVKHILSTGIGNVGLRDAFTKALQDAAPYAASKGVVIGLKPHGGITRTGADCRKFAELVGLKGFGLWFDPGNFIHYDNLNPSEEVKPMAEYCVAMCVKDCARKPDGKPDVNIRPGTGLVDFASCFRSLKDAGFNGPMLFECLGGETPDVVNANARQAKAYIQDILRSI